MMALVNDAKADAKEARPRLLLVEDEAPIREGLVELFTSQGFDVDAVGDGLAAVERAADGGFDAVLLDIMLPGMDGLSVLSHLRARSDFVPVLLLTAKGAEEDIVKGLEKGADDYVSKPFGIHELVARVKGLLRRRALTEREPQRRITIDDGAVFDADQLTVSRGGDSVRLTARECALLQFLCSRAHRPVPRDELLVNVWGYRDGNIQTRTVDVHVQQLRAKLKAIGGEQWIGTVRGRGYRFEGRVS
jgi:two-component system response regulator RegX3